MLAMFIGTTRMSPIKGMSLVNGNTYEIEVVPTHPLTSPKGEQVAVVTMGKHKRPLVYPSVNALNQQWKEVEKK